MSDYTDVLKELINIVSSKWDCDSTDNITPIFDYIYNRKSLEHYSNSDFIFFQELSVNELPSSIGNFGRDREYNIRIDIRSNYTHPREKISGREHLFKLKKELLKIINKRANFKFSTGFGVIEINNSTDLSDGLKNLWRAIYEVKITKHNEGV